MTVPSLASAISTPSGGDSLDRPEQHVTPNSSVVGKAASNRHNTAVLREFKALLGGAAGRRGASDLWQPRLGNGHGREGGFFVAGASAILDRLMPLDTEDNEG
jgi:hypothetical protein